MTMKDVHELECPQCKIRDQFYQDFNKDSKKNVPYFGVISYVNHYLFMPVSSDEPKEELSKSCRSSKSSVCFLQLINEWAIRKVLAKKSNKKNGLLGHLKEKKRPYTKTPPFYFPQSTGKLLSIKKSESFTGSSPDNTICSVNLKSPTTQSSPDKTCSVNSKPTKDVYKCKLTKKCPSKEKVARKEPKVGTLKRKRWNWEKLKDNETYEDDLFEEKTFKRILVEDSSNSEEDKILTPQWSVQISPRAESRSPSYEDCYSPTELKTIRKEAEEYQYRRNKRKKCKNAKKGDNSKSMLKKDDAETYKTLEKVRDKLKKLEKEDGESDEDYYFTDGEDSND